MRIQWTLLLGGIGLACQGCGPLAHVGRTLIVEPTLYPRRLDDHVDRSRNKQLSEEAWMAFLEAHGPTIYSEDFELGFKEGYQDYLYSGGSGAPPPVPPRYYWRAEFESQEGHQAIQNWFAGFHEGAMLAKRSGLREVVTLTSSLRRPLPPPPPPVPLPEPPTPSSEVLPRPRPVPPGEVPPLPPAPEQEVLPPPKQTPED
jgi:hypothetical protein